MNKVSVKNLTVLYYMGMDKSRSAVLYDQVKVVFYLCEISLMPPVGTSFLMYQQYPFGHLIMDPLWNVY